MKAKIDVRKARLATRIKNVPAQKMPREGGYARLAEFGEWNADPATVQKDGERNGFSQNGSRVAVAPDEAAVLALWRDSTARAASRATLADRRRHWKDLTAPRVRALIADAAVRLADGGFGFLFASDDEDGGALRLNALAGDDGAMRSIAASARTEAGYRGYSGVHAMLVDQPAVNAALTSAGYRREGGILVYEQPL